MKEEEKARFKLLTLRFKEYMETKEFSPRTIESYLDQLKFFFSYLETTPVKDISEITRETIHNYQMYLYYQKDGERPLALGTQYSRITALRTFFRYLLHENLILYDPTQEIELPKRRKNLPSNIMTKKEVFKILSKPDPDTPLGLRDRAILEVLYSTGIRNSELRNLTIYDVDITNGDLRVVKGKNAKDRVIPLGEIAGGYVEEYINHARPKLTKDPAQKILFLTKNGRPINHTNLIWLIKKYVRKAKLNKPITTHSFRHTMATHLLKNRAPIRHIQAILGHRSLETTQIYTKVEVTDLKKVHSRCHPRERK